jgi:hypothetical protein
LPGFVGLAGWDDEDLYRVRIELKRDLFRVQWADVRVGDEGVAVGRSQLSRDDPDFG